MFSKTKLLVVLTFVSTLVVSCSEDLDVPPMKMAPLPNMSLAEFKAKHWQDGVNYVDTVIDDEIIHGWITANDASGNIGRTLYIMDESGVGIPVAVNAQDLYQKYRVGAEIVLAMKDHHVGKLTGMMQVGAPYLYNNTVWETSYMTESVWQEMGTLNGFPELAKLDTVVIELDEIVGKTDNQTQMNYQGLLVRINDVSFEKGDGKTTYGKKDGSVNRLIIDPKGRKLNVRTSDRASFADSIMPEGRVDLVGVMGYYATRANPTDPWQLYLRDLNDVIVRSPEK